MSLHVLSPEPSCLSIVKHFTPIAIADATRDQNTSSEDTQFPEFACSSQENEHNSMHAVLKSVETGRGMQKEERFHHALDKNFVEVSHAYTRQLLRD